MKRIYIFDLDNTLRASKFKKILPQTIKLIKEISNNPDYILGLATGRGPSKMHVLGELEKCFKYKILVNGAIILEDDHLLDETFINPLDIDFVIKDAEQKGFSVGMVGYNEEALTKYDEHVEYAIGGFQKEMPVINNQYHHQHKVYQLWVFNKDSNLLDELVEKYSNFTPYHWHYGGVDLVYPYVSKDQAVKKLIKKYPDHQLIAVGDGHNDLEMIKMADVGILMENSRWFESAKGNFDYQGPHVDNDELYDFFKKHNLI